MSSIAQMVLAALVIAAGVTHVTLMMTADRAASAAPAPIAESSARSTSWTDHVAVVDDALALGDVSAAVNAWYDAYGAALATRQWEPMLRVGDAFVRIGATAKARAGARANARQAYLVALMRAQRERSVDGTLEVAEAFARLGDREVALACAQVAKGIAEERQDGGAVERVRAFTTTQRPDRS